MIRFYTREFFEEVARRLNADATWARETAAQDLRIVCTALDLRRSFLLHVDRGKLETTDAKPEDAADFRSEGMYADWVSLCKGETEFQRLVETARIRVRGPLPQLMGARGPLNHIVVAARSFPNGF